MPDVIWDSFGRAWTADQFALSDAAKMITIDHFVEVLRDFYGITDPDRLLRLMAMRADIPRPIASGSGPDA